MKKHGVASLKMSSFGLKPCMSLHKPFYHLCRDYVLFKQNLKILVISKIKNKKIIFFYAFFFEKFLKK